MKKEIVFVAAAVIALNAAPIWAQSVGGTQSERSGGDSQTPTSKGRSAGSEDPNKARQSPGVGQTGKDTSVGGSQSQRAGDSDTPVGQGRFGDPSKSDPSSGRASQSPSNKDTSIGGSQSKRAGDSDIPVGQGRFGDPGSRGMSQASGAGSQQDIRQAQEALKNQGHDPGPIDGVMGPQTRQALREFQSSNGLKQSGMLDAETKQKLNINGSSSRSSQPARGQGSAPMGR